MARLKTLKLALNRVDPKPSLAGEGGTALHKRVLVTQEPNCITVI